MINFFKNLFQFKYFKKEKFPRYLKNIWYNYGVHSENQYPIVFDENKKYIDCEVGKCVQMNTTSEGKKVFYEITKMWHTRGSDFLYSSDSINCDMVFSHITD